MWWCGSSTKQETAKIPISKEIKETLTNNHSKPIIASEEDKLAEVSNVLQNIIDQYPDIAVKMNTDKPMISILTTHTDQTKIKNFSSNSESFGSEQELINFERLIPFFEALDRQWFKLAFVIEGINSWQPLNRNDLSSTYDGVLIPKAILKNDELSFEVYWWDNRERTLQAVAKNNEYEDIMAWFFSEKKITLIEEPSSKVGNIFDKFGSNYTVSVQVLTLEDKKKIKEIGNYFRQEDDLFERGMLEKTEELLAKWFTVMTVYWAGHTSVAKNPLILSVTTTQSIIRQKAQREVMKYLSSTMNK